MSDRPTGPNWDERYAGEGYLYGTEPNDFLISAATRIRPGSRVLCVADGEGRNGVYLAGQGHQVTSIDQSRRGLEKAEEPPVGEVSIFKVARDLERIPAHLPRHHLDLVVALTDVARRHGCFERDRSHQCEPAAIFQS